MGVKVSVQPEGLMDLEYEADVSHSFPPNCKPATQSYMTFTIYSLLTQHPTGLTAAKPRARMMAVEVKRLLRRL